VVRAVTTREGGSETLRCQAVAVRGLQAYAVPSARAGQQPDPSVRRDVRSGLLTAGFLLVVIATALAIIVATPEYAEPAIGADAVVAVASLDPTGDPSAASLASDAGAAMAEPTSPAPGKLKGYRWPVKGGEVNQYYDWASDGQFVLRDRRVHAGLVITWFEGAYVKAAHAGEVKAAGKGWEEATGYDAPLDRLYARLRRHKEQPTQGVVIDDGKGYRSVYSGLQDIRVKVGQKVKAGTIIGAMSKTEHRQMMRYELVRMDGKLMRVSDAARRLGYPDYARERIDPLAVLDLETTKRPRTPRQPPADPPRLSDY
jgi:murein DD-endopeptidase MepM/ murein hydrolase activator NlpD